VYFLKLFIGAKFKDDSKNISRWEAETKNPLKGDQGVLDFTNYNL
jgi:hypothetical protein